ncbi:MAG TPA: phage portal protein [Acidimicrobiia bacterium]
MGLFRTKPQPAFGASEQVKAAAGSVIPGPVQTYVVGAGTARALSIPTISRARDLIVSSIAGLDLRQYTLQWTGENYEKVTIPGESWFTRPDPNVPRSFIMAQTVQDLILHGRSFWLVTSRYSTNFPASFVHLPYDNIQTPDQAGPEWFGPSAVVNFNGRPLEIRDVVQFLAPINGLLWVGARTIDIAYRLDEAVRRFATMDGAVSGHLQQVDGEPMSGEELSELAAAWAAARQDRAIGALNQHVKWVESTSLPDKLALTESRTHQAMELARVANIPPWLVGLSAGGMTYENSTQARRDLYLFGALPYALAIQETLSMDHILPRGRHVEFDTDRLMEDVVQNAPAPAPQEVPA